MPDTTPNQPAERPYFGEVDPTERAHPWSLEELFDMIREAGIADRVTAADLIECYWLSREPEVLRLGPVNTFATLIQILAQRGETEAAGAFRNHLRHLAITLGFENATPADFGAK
jgi:hypothetical protein